MNLAATLLLACAAGLLQGEDRKPVDLVPFLDADKDSMAGDWTIDGKVLASPKRARPPRKHLLQIPYLPPPEYDLTLVVESRGPFDPKGDTTSLDVALPFGDNRPLLILDGWDGSIGGLNNLRGKGCPDNETRISGRIFTDATPRTLVYSVRKEGISLRVDGKTLVEWKGAPTDFPGNGSDDEIPDRRTFYLAAWIGYTFRKVELTPVSGKGAVVPRRLKSRLVGGGGGGTFDDTPPVPALLTGLRYWESPWGTTVIVKSVQGIYRGEEGLTTGQTYGRPRGNPKELLAKPGYAVGAIVAKGGARVDGLKVVFMRVGDKGLQPGDSYESEWVGGHGGGPETTLGGDGVPIVGLAGRSGEDLDSIGAVQSEVPPETFDPVRILTERLGNADPAVRLLSCERLSRMGAEALPALEALVDRLKEDADPRVRVAAAKAIGRIGSPAVTAIPALLEGLKQESTAVKSECAGALARLGPAARPALPALTEALDSSDASFRRAAFLALSSLGPDGTAVPRLLQVFRNDLLKDESVRGALASPEDWMSAAGQEGPAMVGVWGSLRALAAIGHDAVPGLAAGLKSDDILYRGVSAVALAMMGGEARAALPSLLEALQDKEPSIRLVALRAIQEVDARAPGVLPALREASRDKDEAVKMLARDTVDHLSPWSLRLSTGDRFTTTLKSKGTIETNGNRMPTTQEMVIEFEVVGPAVTDPPDEFRDFSAPPQFELAEWAQGGSPSGSFRTIQARFHRGDNGGEPPVRFFRDTLSKVGWVLEEGPEESGGAAVLVGVRRNERITVDFRQGDGMDAVVRIAPLRGRGATLLEASTERGAVAIRGRIVKLKVTESGIDWKDSQGALQDRPGDPTLAGYRKLIEQGLAGSVDRRGHVEWTEGSLLGTTPFAGWILSMPGALPEDSGRKEDRWSTDGDQLPVLEHRISKQEGAEVALSTKAILDRAEGNGLPAEKVDGTSTTVFDTALGLPVKSEGRFSHSMTGMTESREFESTFTKLPRR
jgi:HEAT repeat protein